MSVTTREYPSRPLVGIGIAVLRSAPDAVLLVRRARAPALGAWSLPGGAQRLGETAEAAARRELLEETGRTVGDLHLAGHVDSIHTDADGRVRFHYTILDSARTGPGARRWRATMRRRSPGPGWIVCQTTIFGTKPCGSSASAGLS